MKNSQKGFIVPLLIVIIILAIGGGMYLFSKRSANPQSNSIADINKDIITSNDEAQIKKTINNLVSSLKSLDINAYLNNVNSQDRPKYANNIDKGLLRDLKKDYFDGAGNEYPIEIISIKKVTHQQLSSLSAGLK